MDDPAGDGVAPPGFLPAPDLGFVHAFLSSLSMILVSEIGDKTFFIAALMAMRHPRLVVFAGAMSALALMTLISALFGYVTTFIPRMYTYYISTALFAMFGFKMLYDGLTMSAEEGAAELEQVRRDVETTPLNPRADGPKWRSMARRILYSIFSRAYLQAVSLTFLAEWGDRSQLATVVLAATEDITGICVGGILGHSICTGLAVLCGRFIAQRISVKTVTIIGGIFFLGFAIVSLFLRP